MKCAVKTCTNKLMKNDKSRTFFHFPKDEEQLKKWLEFSQNKGTFKPTKWRICMNHFKEEDYGGKMYDMGYITKRTLKSGAYPCFYNIKESNTEQDQRNIRRKIINSLLREYEQSTSSEPNQLELDDEPMQSIPKQYSKTMPAESQDPLEIKIEKIPNEDKIEMLEKEVMLLKKENKKLKDDLWRSKRKLECEIEELKRKLANSKFHCQSKKERFEDYIMGDQEFITIKKEFE